MRFEGVDSSALVCFAVGSRGLSGQEKAALAAETQQKDDMLVLDVVR